MDSELIRRKPVKRSHRKVVGTAVVDSKLLCKVVEGIKSVAGIKTLLILAVAALDLTIVPRRVGADQSVSNPQISGSFLKQGHAVTLAVGKTGTASLL